MNFCFRTKSYPPFILTRNNKKLSKITTHKVLGGIMTRMMSEKAAPFNTGATSTIPVSQAIPIRSLSSIARVRFT